MQLHTYVEEGNIEGVASELARGVSIDRIDRTRDQTPLMCAVSARGQGLDMLRFLIDKGADVNLGAGMVQTSPLELAVKSGSLAKTRLLLEAGAKIGTVGGGGTSLLVSAMYGWDSAREADFLELLGLLIEKGADLNRISDYGESALRIASNKGAFKAVEMLLAAGADRQQLEWTELMHAIVSGSVEEVSNLLRAGVDLAARDFWERTPWLLSLQVGNVDKAKLLLAASASRDDRGRCGKTPLMYPIVNAQADMLRWLISEGFDIDATDEYQRTALIMAAEEGANESVRILLDAGAQIFKTDHCGEQAIHKAANLDIVRMLLAKGADLDNLNDDMRRAFTRISGDDKLRISKEEYLSGRHRRFGTSNPEEMNIPFWRAMVSSGINAWRARDAFGDTRNTEAGPVWSFSRFGKSLTELPDGTIIEIGGEHEDSYDPDFCIYNEVVVHRPDGSFQIFGYPKEVFPPTDFHSATLVGSHIYVIGSLGYSGERTYGETPVYRLCCVTFKIEKIETGGVKPGWIHDHRAYRKGRSLIAIRGGKVGGVAGDVEEYRDNLSEYVLDLADMRWSADSGDKPS